MKSRFNGKPRSVHPMVLLTLGLLAALVPALVTRSADAAEIPVTSAGHPAEGDLSLQLGNAAMTMQQVFKGERFPNIVVATDGTLLASWGTSSVRVRRSEDGGTTWGPEITIGKPGFQGGGLTVDETTGDVLAFVEDHHPPAKLTIYRSQNHGKSWQAEAANIKGDQHGNVPSMHMNEHGITLRRGAHKGRLIRPTRWYAGKNDRSLWPQHYTNAMFSDDGGKSWLASAPFPAFGTGEATIAELSDGTVIEARKVVLAAGLGAARLGPKLGFRAPVRPQRGQVLITERLPKLLSRPTVDLRQVAEGGLQIGATNEEVGFDDATTPEAMARLAATAVRTLPALARARLVRAWAALRVMTPDGLPIYQQSHEMPGAYLVTCHSGITLAAAHARLLPAWLEGAPDAPNLEVFSEDRFALS